MFKSACSVVGLVFLACALANVCTGRTWLDSHQGKFPAACFVHFRGGGRSQLRRDPVTLEDHGNKEEENESENELAAWQR